MRAYLTAVTLADLTIALMLRVLAGNPLSGNWHYSRLRRTAAHCPPGKSVADAGAESITFTFAVLLYFGLPPGRY